MAKKPSQFYFETVATHTLHETTDHKINAIKASDMKKLLGELDDSHYVDISIGWTGIGSGEAPVTFKILKKVQHSPQEHAALLAESSLRQKLSINEKTIKTLAELQSRLAGAASTDAYTVAKSKLDKLLVNDRIPPDVKKRLVDAASAKVRLLELKVNCEAPELLKEVKEKMNQLVVLVEAEKGILNMQTDYRPPTVAEPQAYEHDYDDVGDEDHESGCDCDHCDS